MKTLGFDTSNYTSSVAWTDGESEINVRQLLNVKKGERGIRQSEGVFQHVKLLPQLLEELASKTDIRSVAAVGASVRPRTVEGSYMPVFLTGHGYARAVSSALGVPLYEFSHQDGHVMSGIYSCRCFDLLEKPFISIHLSGGTTEILVSEYKEYNFTHKIIGATKDISAGQFIDRIGVKLGLDFPAGKSLEALAKTADREEKLPVSADGSYVSFSGVETKASRIAETSASAASLALGVLYCVRDTLVRAINHAIKNTDIHDILIVGGVASNTIIRRGFTDLINGSVYFASPSYSTDNAVGIAYLTYLQGRRKFGTQTGHRFTD